MTEKHFILATAGHVDHGKSALVKALTGTDPDRLPEEKARGITIELGFAHLDIVGPNEQLFHVGLVDVPGHEDFVRNMIAGVGSIDFALLVVAADDGWMPQTEEHLQILIYAGIKRVVVAVTKSDLGDARVVKSQIREQLGNTPFSDAQIIFTSARTGEGTEDLKRALTTECAQLPGARDIGKPRLFVDRTFSLVGIGTVVTGTLTGGTFQRGQTLMVQPGNFPARARSLQNHNRDVEVACPGTRTAINLPDVEIGSAANSVQRGDVITLSELGRPTSTIDALLQRSSRLSGNTSVGRPVKNGSSIYLHHGTTRVAARIQLLETEAIRVGEKGLARLRLTAPLFAFAGDRFVVRDASEQHTLAGGIVLDPDAGRVDFRNAEQLRFLNARAIALNDAESLVRSELARSGFASTETFLRKSLFSAKDVTAALATEGGNGAIVLRGAIAANANHWRDLLSRAANLIDHSHKNDPQARGLPLTELRRGLEIRSDDLFEALISDLCKGDFIRAGAMVARRLHRPELPPALQTAAELIRTALSNKPFDPPSRKELAHHRNQEQAVHFLLEQGEIVEIGPDLLLLSEHARQMITKVVLFLETNQSATASELRQEIDTSRRVIIPFLEHLDRVGVTQRVGDSRQLRQKKTAAAAQK